MNREKKRLYRVMQGELTPRQRQMIEGYYMDGKTIAQLAKEYGVYPSTVSRTLIRARNILRKFLQY